MNKITPNRISVKFYAIIYNINDTMLYFCRRLCTGRVRHIAFNFKVKAMYTLFYKIKSNYIYNEQIKTIFRNNHKYNKQ